MPIATESRASNEFRDTVWPTRCREKWGHVVSLLVFKQEAQLSQRNRAMLRVIKYFAEVTQAHSKLHPWVGHVEVPDSIPP